MKITTITYEIYRTSAYGEFAGEIETGIYAQDLAAAMARAVRDNSEWMGYPAWGIGVTRVVTTEEVEVPSVPWGKLRKVEAGQ